MSDCIYTIDQIKMYLAPVLSQYNVKSATLFGSYGKGSANASSDVDLLVDSGLKGLKFVGLIEALRAALDKEMDVFDVSHVEKGTEIEHVLVGLRVDVRVRSKDMVVEACVFNLSQLGELANSR